MTYEFLGKSAEAAVYSYVGISLYTSIPGFWSFSFITAQFFIIVIGRIVAVIATFYAFRLCFRKKTIKFKELLFIIYGGMIRGAIAFALVLKIPIEAGDLDSERRYSLYRSTCLIVVMATTLFFGTFMKMTQGILLGEHESHDLDNTFLGLEARKTHYENIAHPNLDVTVDTGRKTYLLGAGGDQGGFANSKFANWFANLDEHTLRPFLIRNYTLEAIETMEQINALITKNFDDKEPDEVQLQIEEMERRTRMMSVTNANFRTTLAVQRDRKSTIDIRKSNLASGQGNTLKVPEHMPAFGTVPNRSSNLYQSIPVFDTSIREEKEEDEDEALRSSTIQDED